jgi:hypothetical protein
VVDIGKAAEAFGAPLKRMLKIVVDALAFAAIMRGSLRESCPSDRLKINTTQARKGCC